MPARWVKQFGMERLLPTFARDALSMIPDEMTSAPLPAMVKAGGESRGRVGFVSGCVMSVMFAETNAATVRLIQRAGFDVVTPPAQGCCGALFAHGGNLEEARAAARRNIAVFEQAQVETIVINAAGCGSTLKEYGHLLRDDPAWVERARHFSSKVRDLTEWLTAVGEPIDRGTNCSGKVTYHDACHLAHAQRIEKAPRTLVRAVAGETFVELPESNVCCGSAGSYNLTEPEMAARLQQRKTDNILKTGAKTVVTTNPGCLLQMRAGLKKAGAHDVEVVHIADFLDREARRASDA
jgi:glycolate oxidase iron-sulfur subunit